MRKSVICGLLLASLLAGCGKGGETVNAADESPYRALGWTGLWKNECVNEDGRSHLTTITISDTGTERVFTRYLAANCRAGDERVVYVHRYQGAREIRPSDLEGWRTIRQEVVSITGDIKIQQLANEFNQHKHYGYDDWKVGEPKDLTGRKFDDADKANPAVGAARYFTMTMEGDVLRFADYVDHQAKPSADPEDRFRRVK